jgi:uncharacterized membrane protein
MKTKTAELVASPTLTNWKGNYKLIKLLTVGKNMQKKKKKRKKTQLKIKFKKLIIMTSLHYYIIPICHKLYLSISNPGPLFYPPFTPFIALN